MKSTDYFKLLMNPFHRIAGWEATVLGLVVLLISTLIGKYSSVVFNGALDIHLVDQVKLDYALGSMAIGVVSLIVVLGITGTLVARGFRWIDMTGTLLLSKAPLLIAALAGFITVVPPTDTVQQNPSLLLNSISFVVVLLLIIPVSIWSITLAYNAFRITTGLKGIKTTIAFVVGIFIAELISFTVIQLLFK